MKTKKQLAEVYANHIIKTDAPFSDPVNIAYDFLSGYSAAEERAAVLVEALESIARYESLPENGITDFGISQNLKRGLASIQNTAILSLIKWKGET